MIQTKEEIVSGITQLNTNVTSRSELFKNGGSTLDTLTTLIQSISETDEVSQQFNNAVLLPLYENKNNKNNCDS